MKRNYLIFGITLLIMGVILAPFAFQLFRLIFLQPAAYYWWRVRQIIRVIPQSSYWLFVIISLGLVVIYIQLRNNIRIKEYNKTSAKREGAVEQFTEYLNRSERSNYFKWVIANHLANLDLKIRRQYSGNIERENQHISGMKGDGTPLLEKYFSAGLNTSFMAYQKKRKLLSRKNGSPLDIELEEVINFLESQMEMEK
jgi:hypothetical protein